LTKAGDKTINVEDYFLILSSYGLPKKTAERFVKVPPEIVKVPGWLE
jgi:hypothetical protein